MFCMMCGAKVPVKSNFCAGCGRMLTENEKQILENELSEQIIETNKVLFEKTMQEKKDELAAQEQKVETVNEESKNIYETIEEKDPHAGSIAREIEKDLDTFRQESEEKTQNELKPPMSPSYEAAMASLHEIREETRALIQPRPEELAPDPVEETIAEESVAGENEMQLEELKFEEPEFKGLDEFLNVTEGDNPEIEVEIEAEPTSDVEVEPFAVMPPEVDTAETVNVFDFLSKKKETPSESEEKNEPPSGVLDFLNNIETPEPMEESKPLEDFNPFADPGIGDLVDNLFTGNLASKHAAEINAQAALNTPDPIPQEPPQVIPQMVHQESPQAVPQENPVSPNVSEKIPKEITQEVPDEATTPIANPKTAKNKSAKKVILMVILVLLLLVVVFELIASVAILFFPQSSLAVMFNKLLSFLPLL